MSAYKLEELAREAGVAPRTVRYYVQRGLLPAPAFRGRDTTYGPDHLARLRAIKRLQQAYLPLDEIQGRLASASASELERLATDAAAPAPPAGLVRSAAPAAERWERIVLDAGLELHVRLDASPAARRAAAEIVTTFGPRAAEEPRK